MGAADFDDANASAEGLERLRILCAELSVRPDPDEWAPMLFLFLVRLGGAELGDPGPVVHVLEQWRDGYQRFLAESMRRKPTPLTAWMVNRVLNRNPPDRELWMAMLERVPESARATPEAVAEAQQFLAYRNRC